MKYTETKPSDAMEKYKMLRDLVGKVKQQASLLEVKVTAGQVIDSASFEGAYERFSNNLNLC